MMDEDSEEDLVLSSDNEEEGNSAVAGRSKGDEGHLEKAMSRVELIRLLYLIPFIM